MTPTRLRAAAALATLLAAICMLLAGSVSGAQPSRHVEVAEVEGIMDAPVIESVRAALRIAKEEGARALVVQIDSKGGIDPAGLDRLVDEILRSDVPVITWVGPPGARAEGGSAVLATTGHVVAMAPGAGFGPANTLDLRSRVPDAEPAVRAIVQISYERLRPEADVAAALATERYNSDDAEDAGLVAAVAPQLPDLLQEVDGTTVQVGGKDVELDTDPDGLSVRFRKMSALGRVQHAVAQPSIVYLLLLLGLVGVVFEIFHPSTGPAGASGALSLLMAGYGLAVLDGSWVAAAIVVAGVAFMSVDLRMQGLGVFTLLGIAGLVGGSLMLFPSPNLRASPWVLVIGVVSMSAFMVSAMTRVLADLRAVMAGELEVSDPVEALHKQVGEPAAGQSGQPATAGQSGQPGPAGPAPASEQSSPDDQNGSARES